MDNFKNKKNKIIQRTISLMLCMALLFSSINILGLFNNISAVEEETTIPDDSPKNRVIQKFYDENIIININSINEAEMYLPATIRVLYNTGIEEVIDVFDWTQIKDCGVDENNIHTYYFEGKIDENYKVSSDISLPIATVNIVDSNKLEISEEILTDYGNYFDWLNKIEAKEEVCPNCFRPLQDGTCSECLKNDCDCEEIDIDLTNLNSIEAWSNKYSPYAVKVDETFYETRILFYDNDWWNNLKPNQKEVAERIYSHVIYNHTLYNGTQFADATVSDLLVFVKNNRTGMSNLEALHYFFPDCEAYVREDILEKLIELDPNMPIKCMYGMHTYVFFNDYYNKDIFGRQVSPLTEYWNNDEKLEKLYYVALMFEETNVATALNKNIKSTINTSLLTDKRNYIQKTKKTTVNTAKATAGNTITLSATPKNKYGIEHIYKTNDSSTPLTFCLNHGKAFKANVTYEYSEDKNGKIGGIAKDIMTNHSNPEGSDTDLQYYAAAQQAIWALIKTELGYQSESELCDEKSDIDISSGMRPSMGATVSGYALKYYDEAPSASYSIYKISSACVDRGKGVDDYQPMLILESPPPDPNYHAVNGSQDSETNRNRLVVKHNLTSSNGSDISDSGTNIIGTWKPDNSTLWTLSNPYATICGSSSWFEDSEASITENLNFNFSFGLAEKINAFSCCNTTAPSNAWYSFDKYSQSFSTTGSYLSNSQLKAESASPFYCIKDGWKNRHYGYGPNLYSLNYNYNTPHDGFSDSGYSGIGVKHNDKNQVTDIQFGTVSTSCYYTTFKTNYSCDASSNTTHKVYKPKVTNYELTLHYQGGWVTSDPTTYSTYTMNSGSKFDYSSVTSFDLTHNATNKETYDNCSKEKTNVQFTDASVNNYKLTEYKTTKTSGFSGNTWTTSSNYFNFRHSDSSLDGVTTLAEFKYKNYYIVSLPTPVRTGYNFLGWFTESEGGTQVFPQTIIATPTEEVYGTTAASAFTNAYVIKADTTLYAHWELITKDEEFTVDWLDNDNCYTTRPKAIYVELYRYANNKQDSPELCKGFISENVTSTTSIQTNWRGNDSGLTNKYTSDTNDWVSQFHNDSTGITVTKTDPNTGTNTTNPIFYGGNTFQIKVTPDNVNFDNLDKNPATTNHWSFKLNNLQKYDTYQYSNHEYTYVIKAITVESMDNTTQYYVSPYVTYNNYTSSWANYYNIKDNVSNNNGQQILNQYNTIAKKNLTKNVVCKLANTPYSVKGTRKWKNITAFIQFEDPQTYMNGYNNDNFRFRPYELKLELYQNYANYKNPNGENHLNESTGVRVLYRTQVVRQLTNAYSCKTAMNQPGNKNALLFTFTEVPTIEDSTCIKIAYDVILTHGESRYRYTVDSTDPYNNLGQSIKNYGSSHYYANKHQYMNQTISDLNYRELGGKTIIPTIYKEVPQSQYDGSKGTYYGDTKGIIHYYMPDYTKLPTGYMYKSDILSVLQSNSTFFNIDNYINIFQFSSNGGLSTLDTDNSVSINMLNQIATYNNGSVGYGFKNNTSTYSGPYKSMAYNLRYYYLTEDSYMRAVARNNTDIRLPIDKQIEYLQYTETLYWHFTASLNGNTNTPLPGEYSGSNSADDRTGDYNNSTNDDYTHTNNKLTITSSVKNQSGNIAEDEAYKNIQLDQSHEGFLITLKQIKKVWTSSGMSTGESYDNNQYSKNGYIYYLYSSNKLTRIFQPEAEAPTGTGYTAIGNEYNIYVPANGSTTLEYLPDGKYEVTCHYDIDFSNFTFATTAGKTASITKESNGKYYLTFSSATVKDNQNVTHSATIDYWRGYVDDMNNFSWARPLRDNNFNLVSGTPSNISDKTLYPFGNNDEKNEVTYGTKDVIAGTGYHVHNNYDDKNPSLNPYSSISNYFITKEYMLK